MIHRHYPSLSGKSKLTFAPPNIVATAAPMLIQSSRFPGAVTISPIGELFTCR
jgi:hypothetical protein